MKEYRFFSIFRSLLAWAFTAVYWSVFLTIYVLSLRMLPNQWVTKRVRNWSKRVFKILSIQLEFSGENPLDSRAARVIVCNHQSALDIVWGATVYPPYALVIGKKEIIWTPFVNVAWWAFRNMRIDRKNPKKAITSLKYVSDEIVRNNRSLFIAPEGTRSPDGNILPFKKGAFHIAIQSQTPIYPIVATGALDLLPKGAFFAQPGVIKIRFLPPHETRGLSLKDVTPLMEKVRQDMIKAYNEMQTPTKEDSS